MAQLMSIFRRGRTQVTRKESHRSQEERKKSRRRRLQGILSSIRQRVEEVCGRAQKADDFLEAFAEIRDFLDQPEVQELLSYRAQRRLEKVVRWYDTLRRTSQSTVGICSRTKEALEYADIALSRPDTLLDRILDRIIEKGLDEASRRIADRLRGPWGRRVFNGKTIKTASVTALMAGAASAAVVAVLASPADRILASQPPAQMDAGRTAPISARVTGPSGNVLYDRTISWSSSNPAVITVSPEGEFKGVINGWVMAVGPGSADIHIISENATAIWSVDVLVPPSATPVVPDGASPPPPTHTPTAEPPAKPEPRLTINGEVVSGSNVGAADGTVRVQPAPGLDGRYPEGSAVSLHFEPGPGFAFGGWGGDCVGDNAICNLVMDADKRVEVYSHHTFNLIINGSPVTRSPVQVDGGWVEVSPLPDAPGGAYRNGTGVTLVAFPQTRQEFHGWLGDCAGSGPACRLTMDQGRAVNVRFSPTVKCVAVNGGPVVGASVETDGGTVMVTSTAQGADGCYPEGSTLTLSVQPYPGSHFDGWGGNCAGTSLICRLVMDADRTVYVYYLPTFTLVVGANPVAGSTVAVDGGTVEVSPLPNAPGSRYVQGTQVSLTPSAGLEWEFQEWLGDCAGPGVSCRLAMDRDRRVDIRFRPTPKCVSVNEESMTDFSVETYGGMVTATSTARGEYGCYPYGSIVTLTAGPDAGFEFVSWGGDCEGYRSGNSCEMQMDGDKDVTASFRPVEKTFRLVVDTVPAGGGAVHPRPLPGAPNGRYAAGTTVTLVARASDGYIFGGWGSGCLVSGQSCQLVMDSDKHIKATFHPVRSLSINGSPVPGSPVQLKGGQVDLAPAPNTPQGHYIRGSIVTLTAEPDPGFRFKGWEAPCETTSKTCNLIMDRDIDVRPVFVLDLYYRLTTSVFPQGAGQIEPSSPPDSRDGRYSAGTEVFLTATPSPGYRFTRWRGDCAQVGEKNTCRLVMDSDKVADAQFQLEFRVTRVEILNDAVYYQGECPTTIELLGEITTVGDVGGEVAYSLMLMRSEVNSTEVHTLRFDKSGTQRIGIKWDVGQAGRSAEGLVVIQVWKPQEVQSKPVKFSIQCGSMPAPKQIQPSRVLKKGFSFNSEGNLDTIAHDIHLNLRAYLS